MKRVIGFFQNKLPMIGAEVFIEPGQTTAEIDTWFKRMSESGMTVTRIRMTENFMHKQDGSWDFNLFDHAFAAGEKYHIKIYANLFPATSFEDIGGFKFPGDEAHLTAIAAYIKAITSHFKQFSSLYGWVPINEPGSGDYPKTPYSLAQFSEWKSRQPVSPYQSKGFVHFDFSDERFLMDYNTWFLKWLTDEIHKYNPGSIIHVNNHALFQNAAEYNFPEWRKFLTSLGGSAHASWHFNYFNRNEYALAVSANSEMLRSGAGNIPWFMTELQGGNNTYSGYLAICPSAEEISQWLWITIGTESKGAIFWCLNPRSSGIEAGEWSMLNYHNEPSDRMLAAAKVIRVINEEKTLFSEAKTVESGINILYTRESLWVEKKLQTGGKKYEGRDEGGVMKSALGYFEALSENGIQANFKEISEFDFSKDNYQGVAIILAHQISIPSRYWRSLEEFVGKGGKLIADGLTAYYDENAVCLMKTGFPLRNLFGGDILEYKAMDGISHIKIENDIDLPAYLWKGLIRKSTGTITAIDHTDSLAIKNTYGKGEVYWIPSLVGLGSRINQDYSQLNLFLARELNFNSKNIPFSFQEPQKGLLMKTMASGLNMITILVNKSDTSREFKLNTQNPSVKSKVIFADKQGTVIQNMVRINPEETLVVKWR